MHRRTFLGGAGVTLSTITAALAAKPTGNSESHNTDTADDGFARWTSSTKNGEATDTGPERDTLAAGGSLRITNDSESPQFIGVTVLTEGQAEPLFQYHSNVKPGSKIVASGIVSEAGQYSVEVTTADTEERKEWEVTEASERRNVRIGFDAEGELTVWVIRLV